MANEFIIKKGFISKANSVVSGSLIVTEGISGSFSGSFEGDGSGLTNLPASSPFPFSGSAVITGSLIVSGSNLTSGFRTDTRNVILGYGAGNNQDPTNGPYNVMIGFEAGYTNTIGDSNVCLGQYAGYALSTNASDENIFIGKLAGAGGTSPVAKMSDANFNIGIGGEALLNLVGGDQNISIGFRSSRLISSGLNNIAVGESSLGLVTSGDHNIGIGYNAGLDQTTGDGNITIGSGSLGVAGESNQLRIGNGNTITTISASLATGDIIFPSTASAAYFSGDGSQLTNLPTSSTFPFEGDAVITGSLLISGSFNAFKLDTTSIILGNLAGNALSTGGADNVMIGYKAGTAVSTGDQNVFIGQEAAKVGNQSKNIAVGCLAGVGYTGEQNVSIGYQAGYGAALASAEEHNTQIGGGAGRNNWRGSGNTFIGYYAGYNGYDNEGCIIIGSGSKGPASATGGLTQQLRIGNGESITTISASLVTGDIIFPSTASAAYFVGDGSNLTNIPSPSGKIGIADANGVYTYYSTLSASLQSATEGDTIELFANVTENWGTSDPETHLKNNVNFNFNGHTYFFTGSKSAGGITCLTDNSVTISCSFYNGRIKFKEDEVGGGSSNRLLLINSQGSHFQFNGFEIEGIHQDISPHTELITNYGTIVGGTYIARSGCSGYLLRNNSTSTTEKAFIKNATVFYYGTNYGIYNYFSAVLSNCDIYYEGSSTAVYQGNFSGMLKDSSIYCQSGNGVIGGEVIGCNIHVKSGYGHDQTTSGGVTPKTINTYIQIEDGANTHDGIKATYDVSNVHIVHNDDGGGHGIELNGSAVRVNGAIIVGRDWGSSYPLHINASNTVISNASIRSTYPATNQTAVYIASGVTNSTLLNNIIEVAGSGGTHIGISAADDDTEVKYSHIQFLNKSSGTLNPVNEIKVKQTMGSTSDPYSNIVIE